MNTVFNPSTASNFFQTLQIGIYILTAFFGFRAIGFPIIRYFLRSRMAYATRGNMRCITRNPVAFTDSHSQFHDAFFFLVSSFAIIIA